MKLMEQSVLHCFGSYLPVTENWAYQLIANQENTIRLIGSAKFLCNDFYSQNLTYLRCPLQPKAVENSSAVIGSVRRALGKLNSALYPSYVSGVLRKRRIDIVHSHFANVGWKYRSLAHRLHAFHVVSFYGLDYEQMETREPVWKSRLPVLFERADMFICEGPHGAGLLANKGCDEDKIRICKLGVEVDQIPFLQRDKSSQRLRLLQLASFKDKKGQVDTVLAFAAALEGCPDMHLTLAGASPGIVTDNVLAEVARLGISERVTLLPGIAPDAMHAFMGDFDVFIHPSRHAADGDCEGGAPIVLLDAQATGMPVISTRHCDIPQEVVDGTTGVLCKERDVGGLAEAIRYFYNMPAARYAEVSRAARSHVVANFNARDCARHMESLYLELKRR